MIHVILSNAFLALAFDGTVTLGNVIELIGIVVTLGMIYGGIKGQFASLETTLRAHGDTLDAHSERMEKYEEGMVKIVGQVQRIIGRLEVVDTPRLRRDH